MRTKNGIFSAIVCVRNGGSNLYQSICIMIEKYPNIVCAFGKQTHGVVLIEKSMKKGNNEIKEY